MSTQPIAHIRSDILQPLESKSIDELSMKLADERADLFEERASLLETMLTAIDGGDADTIERVLARKERIDARLKALELAAPTVRVEIDRRLGPGQGHVAGKGVRAAGRAGYIEAVKLAYRELSDVDAAWLTVTWHTQAELDQLEADQRTMEEGLARAPLAGQYRPFQEIPARPDSA